MSTSIITAVRALYDAIELHDATMAAHLDLDRTALRAVNLMEHGPVSPGELGSRLGLASGSVTALLDRLERANHIKRQLSAKDRRRRDAVLTKEAHAAAGAVYARLGAAIEVAFSGLSEEQKAEAVRALDTLRGAFRAATDELASG